MAFWSLCPHKVLERQARGDWTDQGCHGVRLLGPITLVHQFQREGAVSSS